MCYSVSASLKYCLRVVARTLAFAVLCDPIAYAIGFPIAPAAIQTTQPALPPQAPIPTQIAAAHKVFLVNDGADTNFPLTAERSYNEIYAALKIWGHFELVSSPTEADLVFQLREIAPVTAVTGDRNNVYSIASPAFQLSIKDPKSNVTLWTITSPVQLAGRKKARTHWLNIAVTNVVSRVKVLSNQPLSATEIADLTLAPHYHGAAFAITLTAVVVGASVATGLILKHEFDKNVANQTAALCSQNPALCNIPTP
jgi:hypothetical protein